MISMHDAIIVIDIIKIILIQVLLCRSVPGEVTLS